jgi:uncharacterized membrane protein (UPF0127 family)
MTKTHQTFRQLAGFAAFAFLISCTTIRAEGQAMVLPVDPAPLVAETGKGDVSFKVEVADDEKERSAGLMYRNYLPDDRGMLFVFPQQRQVGFWMKNTPLPLDLVFIDEQGVVQGVGTGEPFSEAAITPGVPVQYVLELKRGTAARLGIEKGVEIHHP